METRTDSQGRTYIQPVGWDDIGGTSLNGYIRATKALLTSVFGEPDTDDLDKVTTEWRIQWDDGVVATVYDWKRYEMGAPGDEEIYEWHIGGFDAESVVRVADEVESASARR